MVRSPIFRDPESQRGTAGSQTEINSKSCLALLGGIRHKRGAARCSSMVQSGILVAMHAGHLSIQFHRQNSHPTPSRAGKGSMPI